MCGKSVLAYPPYSDGRCKVCTRSCLTILCNPKTEMGARLLILRQHRQVHIDVHGVCMRSGAWVLQQRLSQS